MRFDDIVYELHEAVGASRTTLRLPAPDRFFPVVAERLAPGVASIRDDTSIDLRSAPTFRYLEREKKVLIQNDCAGAPEAPPAGLLAAYGVRAQMLAPILRDGELAGILSVHFAPAVRRWTPRDVALLDDAARAITDALDVQPG